MKASNDFKFRLLTNDDYYNTLIGWWGGNNFPPPGIDFLPRTGVMVSKDGVDLYAGFIYYTGSAWGWIEYVVSNPDRKTVSLKKGALGVLVRALSVLAKDNGVKCLFTSTVLDSFKNSLVKEGFEIGDIGNYQLVKKI